ncbi:MAG TPA: hypothetical protein VFE51_09045 [Verrucomicrobiae bacterium]|nr:hypothetical protein [Verrucomicrobiae bacterium]
MKIFPVVGLFLLLAGTGFAQGAPHLAYSYPAGGKIGSTFQITVGGQFLMMVSNAYVTGPGVSATVLHCSRPMGQKEFKELRDRLKELQLKFQARNGESGTNVWTAEDATERDRIRAKLLNNPPNRTANPALTDTVTINIAIATNATPGDQEIRLATPNALSNPLRFCLDTLPEVSKSKAVPANPDVDKFLERIGGRPASVGTPKYESRISLPAIVNGQIMPGGVDRYRFFARHGQQLIIAAKARDLIPYIADAVPGWFELSLTLRDSKGKELASAQRYRFKPDPVIHFEVPRDEEYTVEIHDSIFRGREDFVYRVAIGELPFVTGVFPLGGRLGEKTSVRLTGWNLPTESLSHDNVETGITLLGGNFLNTPSFDVENLPECIESQSIRSIATAQAVELPVIINGRISYPGDNKVFEFEGRSGEKIVAEVFARRLDSPLDSCIRLTSSEGKQLAFNDDFEDRGSGLNTHHADSYLSVTLPADGIYFLQLTDTQGKGGPEFGYRLRLSELQPDFALRIIPSSISLRTGMSARVTVYALRRDGFTNAINLELKDAPQGFSMSGACISEGQDKAQFTLKAPTEATGAPTPLTIEGHALIAGRLVTHQAVPAEDMMQAFIYRHLVPAVQFAVMVAGQDRPLMRDAFRILDVVPLKISPGGSAHVRVRTPGNFCERFNLELHNAPDGISLDSVSPIPGGVEMVVTWDATKVKAGTSGNLICNVVPKHPSGGTTEKKNGLRPQRGFEATLPAIPFNVVAE